VLKLKKKQVLKNDMQEIMSDLGVQYAHGEPAVSPGLGPQPPLLAGSVPGIDVNPQFSAGGRG